MIEFLTLRKLEDVIDIEAEKKFVADFSQHVPANPYVVCECNFDPAEDSLKTCCASCIDKRQRIASYTTPLKKLIETHNHWKVIQKIFFFLMDVFFFIKYFC